MAWVSSRRWPSPTISHEDLVGSCRDCAKFRVWRMPKELGRISSRGIVAMGLFLWDALGVTVHAFDGMDVVGTLGVFESRVHGFDVDAAIGKLGMTRCT